MLLMRNTLSISIVIITYNEAAHIAACIASARGVSNDIIVVDCNSTDGTAQRAALAGARVITQAWQGYGHARNTGASVAQHNWILALDADERLPASSVDLLKETALEKGIVYRFHRRNHVQGKRIRFGAYGFDRIARLYNREDAKWNGFPVHECLEGNFRQQLLKARIDHFGISDLCQYRAKKMHYALLSSHKYALQGKKATWMKYRIAPLFDALKSYILLLGIIDGVAGWYLAATTFQYTKRKYLYLKMGFTLAGNPARTINLPAPPIQARPASAAS
jgi:glycosyltransferase involved in cell wall biosynthesis